MLGVKAGKKVRAGIFLGLILVSIVGLSLWSARGRVSPLAQNTDGLTPLPVVLTAGQERYPLGLHLEILEDKEGQWTIEDVTSPELARQFQPNREAVPVFGLTDSAYWVRVRVINEGSTNSDWRLQQHFANMQFVDLYQPHPDRPGFELKRSGTFVPVDSRNMPYFAPVFILPLPAGADQTLYLRLKSGSSMTINLILWSYPAFVIQAERELLMLGLFFGILLAMIGYHLFLWLTLRDQNYLYYIWFVASCLLFSVAYEGIGMVYLWPRQIGWQQVSVLYGVILIMASALVFSATFLDTRQQLPRWHRLISFLLFVWGLFAVSAIVFSYGFIAQKATFMIAVSPFVSLGAGIDAWRRGYRPARYFVLAWLLFAFSLSGLALTRADFLPSNPVTERGYFVGMTAFVLLWSLGLGDRINLIKRDQAAAQAALLRQKDEFTQTLQQANESLEQRVAARTLELGQAKEAAEAANRTKSVFLARMSHDLRTPLGTILGYTQLMQHDPVINLTEGANLQAIAHSGEYLLALIDDALEMSRIDAGGVILNTESFNLLNLLANLESMLRLLAADRGLLLKVQLAPNLPRIVEIDGHKLQQVLLNLLGNAVKFTEQGSVTLRVNVKDEGENVKLFTFEVADTGPGISAAEIATLFQPFVQGQAGRKAHRGAGLGLAISYQHVQMMGGDLRVASDGVPGHGSVFSFDLPLVVPAAESAELTVRRCRVAGLAAGQPAYRLLVVEDDPDNRRWLGQLLAGVGFTVKEAENGQQAIQIWTEWQPQLILTDLSMPVMTGLEATKYIKARSGGPETVIIAATASAYEDEREDILAAGCDDFVRKPLQEWLIFELLAKHLGAQYVYRDEVEAAPAQLDPSLVRGALAKLPPAWLERLERAVARSEIEEIDQVIGLIGTKERALAEMLANLAHNFEFQPMLALLQASPAPLHNPS